MIKRDRKSKGGGQAPQFRMRIDPSLRDQLDKAAADEGISLASWFKNLAREALEKKGIKPKG